MPTIEEAELSPKESASPEPSAKPKKHNRSRGGCTRCRQRRQKCDEGKPACSRCHDNGIEKCAYTVNLQWGGRDFKSYKGISDIRKHETEPGTFVYTTSSKPKPPQNQRIDRLSRSLSPLDSATPSTQLLLHHFATSASKITSCHATIQSSFCHLLLPMAMSYPPLLSALMALSAIHRNSLFNPSPSPPQPNEIISLKASSITQLRSELLVSNRSMRDAVLATALTLCMCEIHSGADQPRSWRLHLEGAKAILSSSIPSSLSPSNIDPNSQTGLLERWYTSIEALAAISSKGLRAGDMPPSSPNDRVDEMGVDSEEVFLDDYFGFSTSLVPLYKEIGALAWEHRALSNPHAGNVLLSGEDLHAEATLLESRILSMIAREPPNFYPGVEEKLSHEVVKEFYLCNKAYQYSALLHIYRRVMRLDREDERVQGAVRRILECVQGIEPREGLSPYIVLTMPLFTTGQEALGEDRELVRKMMRELGQRLGLRNIWRGLEFLEAGWTGDEDQNEDNCDFIPY